MDPNEEEDENNLHHPQQQQHLSNNRDGFESQLQIQIGPHGGSISASRRRNSGNTNSGSNNMSNMQQNMVGLYNQMDAELLQIQDQRKHKLLMALNSERIRLFELRTEVNAPRSRLQHYPDLDRLKAQNQKLRIECELMTRQVDLHDNGQVPLGETSEEFYRDINPGQDFSSLFNPQYHHHRPHPPPRPPPPRILQLPQQTEAQPEEWCCKMCTFSNNGFLNECEECSMPRFKGHCDRQQNIRVRVVRRCRNYPPQQQQQEPQQQQQSIQIVKSSGVV